MPQSLILKGCYWGTEKYVKKDFQKKYPGSIKSARVGFMSTTPNNNIKDPTYRQVCTGQTGYVEVLLVELESPETTLEPLIKFFFQFHDPTTKNRQGNDTVSSVIIRRRERQLCATVLKGTTYVIDATHCRSSSCTVR